MTEPLAIDCRNVGKSFSPHEKALAEISFSVRAGEMVALIGHSGSGKSTLLRCLSGLIETDRQESHIHVLGQTAQQDGRVSRNIRAIRGNVGFVFQQYNLVERLPLILNVLAGLLGRISRARAALGIFTPAEFERAGTCLAQVGLPSQAWRRTGTLSGGQQQRGAIARALLQDAKIILADEPIASLDPSSAEGTMSLLRKLNKERGITILVSLHQIDFAMRFCDRAVVLHKGRMIYDGPTAGLPSSKIESFYHDEHPVHLLRTEKTA